MLKPGWKTKNIGTVLSSTMKREKNIEWNLIKAKIIHCKTGNLLFDRENCFKNMFFYWNSYIVKDKQYVFKVVKIHGKDIPWSHYKVKRSFYKRLILTCAVKKQTMTILCVKGTISLMCCSGKSLLGLAAQGLGISLTQDSGEQDLLYNSDVKTRRKECCRDLDPDQSHFFLRHSAKETVENIIWQPKWIFYYTILQQKWLFSSWLIMLTNLFFVFMLFVEEFLSSVQAVIIITCFLLVSLFQSLWPFARSLPGRSWWKIVLFPVEMFLFP